ncbi:MAG: carbohydrate kinase family protein [Kiritimatiellia bacterium]
MKTIVVAGHVCLDLIPAFPKLAASLDTLLVPGKLVEVGPTVIATGGAVANTGLALHRLGMPVRLVAKVGDDAFGRTVREMFRDAGAPTDGLLIDPAAATSYSVVLSPAGYDRIFLHCPSANDRFGAADLTPEMLAGASLLHFGYPSLMKRMYAGNGAELHALLLHAKKAWLTTSLDLSLPDPQTPAGQADWRSILSRVLPQVDVFVPSLDELVYMLDRPRSEAMRLPGARDIPLGGLSVAEVQKVADHALDLGAAMVLIKLGSDGVYLQTTRDLSRLQACGAAAPDPVAWHDVSCYATCFEVEVAGTTGAGDCTIAGFLAALVRGLPPDDAVRMAVAVGAASVEKPDATSGVRPWDDLAAHMAAGWKRHAPRVTFPRRV